jgi:FkbM family methyltransferase
MNNVVNKIREFSKQIEDSDFLPNVLGKYHRKAIAGYLPVVLFGAGSAGAHLCNALQLFHVSVTCFCDNNPDFVGGIYCGCPVISVEELRQKHQESLIVISASQRYARHIHDQLTDLGFQSDNIHTPALEPLLYYTNAVNLYWSLDNLEEHARQLQKTYDLYSDAKSKDLFIHRMALLTGGFDYNSFQQFIRVFADLVSDRGPNLFSQPWYDENFFYFNSDFFPLNNNEVFVNVGALVGDCAIEFLNTCKAKGLQYKEIINFEPDPGNFIRLLANLKNIDNVRCLPYGLWSYKSRLRFSNPNQSSAGTPGSLKNDGDLEVEVVSLDKLLPDTEISFIKMDVEGAEMEALRGAADTIRRNTPKLAISVYHKRDDIFEIPLFIHQLHPGYKLYLRHHSSTFGETVLYAVP